MGWQESQDLEPSLFARRQTRPDRAWASPAITLAAARRAALEGKDKAEAGQPMKADLVGAMLDEFFLRYAESLRGADYVRDVIERLVKPEIGSIPLSDIRRKPRRGNARQDRWRERGSDGGPDLGDRSEGLQLACRKG
jgi:hypothetical protein